MNIKELINPFSVKPEVNSQFVFSNKRTRESDDERDVKKVCF